MNALDSESSSGCESGWTLYLEHSRSDVKFVCAPRSRDVLFQGSKMQNEEEEDDEEEEDEEDLSMVSDASSGPPHFHEEDYDYCCNDDDGGCSKHPAMAAAAFSKNSGSKRRKIEGCRENQQKSLLLDDTASSPLFCFENKGMPKEKQASTENLIDYSQGFSATHLQVTYGKMEPSNPHDLTRQN
ncbi:hypothetical protein Nepgr_018261 [Nepenthes gracilis]|uniref:Uncharacterized protein n=1 Tax=Nepenthes gracilis TaxID=150966 RepID=A0AAD3ST10_NEPGR|nr:hypothetical protein Nepgr_018261 [Nepenthes gracilis]